MMLRVVLSCLLITGLNAAVFSQKAYEWKTAQSGGYSYRYVSNDPMQARFYTLENGLSVILSVNNKTPRISCLIPTRAGSTTDPASHTGLAHYLEHMLFKGTDRFGTLDWEKEKPLLEQIDALYERYNKSTNEALRKQIYRQIDSVSGLAARYAIANEYDKLMAEMGAQGTNAFTDNEVTCYLEDIPANAIDRFLAVQAERFRKPVLRIFHTELEAVYEEKNRALDNDGRKVEEMLYAELFPTHNYGQQSTIGTIEHLKNPSLVEIRKYYDTWYVPNNMAIIMAGDFDPDALIKKIDAAFGYMKAADIRPYNPAPEAPLTGVVTREVFGPTPEYVRIGFRLPALMQDVRQQALATLMDEVMANRGAGLIDLNLVKQQKLLSGGSGLDKMKDYSVFTLTARPRQGQSLEEARDLLLGEVEKLKRGDFDPAVLRAIVNNYKLNAIQTAESNDGRAYALLEAFIYTRGENWADISRLTDAMAGITPEAVAAFAREQLSGGYVVMFKRKGEDPDVVKVQKPEITPVEVNREAQSPFLQQVNALAMEEIQPEWLDFKKDFQRGDIGKAPLLYVKNSENELFRLRYRIDYGSYHDKRLPVALQYLQFLDTDRHSAGEISKLFYGLACSYSVNAGGEFSFVSLSGLQENFNEAIALLEHLLADCKPNEEALKQLKARILKSRADNKLNKGAIMRGLTQYARYGAVNPFNFQLSNAEIEALTATELVEILHNLNRREHAVLYYGPLSLPAVQETLKAQHPVPASWLPAPPLQEFKDLTTQAEVLFADYDMVQAEISWVRNIAPYNPKLSPVVSLFNNYFGGGMASVVFQTLRESKALAYSTYAFVESPSKKGERYTLSGYIGCQADKFHEAIAGMNELLGEVPRADKLLETARANMQKGYQTERIRQDDILNAWLRAQLLGLKNDDRKAIYSALGKLRFEDIQAFAKAHISGKPYTYCVVASEKRVSETDLSRYGALRRVSLEELFGY